MLPLKSSAISEGASATMASLAGVVLSSGECAIALVAQIPIIPASNMFFIFVPYLFGALPAISRCH
jgi:hypothetical protein